MIILEKPYVSDFLVETIKNNNFSVLDNEISRLYFPIEKLTSTNNAIKKYSSGELFYTNSENSISWISKNLKASEIDKMIKLSKDKADFREAIKNIYPNYYFEKINYKSLKTFDVSKIKFPIVLKPSIGFLSFGVYPVNNETEWNNIIQKIDSDIEKLKGVFPNDVVDMSDFLIEEMIQGEEYAIDAYFDKNGNAVILNIFKHPFFNGKDVSDRAYYTSKEIIQKYLNPFNEILNKIGKQGNYSNFPFHLELRVDDKNNIIPIELNPMRFCGWCITDIAHHAWGINVYETYLKNIKPDWNKILENSKDGYYYFTIGDIPSDINKKEIKKIDYQKYLNNISNPLEIRNIDCKNNPVFAIVFAHCKDIEEIKNILKLDMREFIIS